MELARIAVKNNHAWKRSVLFIAFAGEEIGLLGSSDFANHPTVPLEGIDAMINMDMIGRMSTDRLFIGGVGTSPSLKQTVEDLNKPVGLALNFSDSGYGSSDHTSFQCEEDSGAVLSSPASTPTTTSHRHGGQDQRRRRDQGAVRCVRDGGPVGHGRAAPALSRNCAAPAGRARQWRRLWPYFGSVPDFRDDLKGVLFSDVQNNSPAAKAGLKGGDSDDRI